MACLRSRNAAVPTPGNPRRGQMTWFGGGEMRTQPPPFDPNAFQIHLVAVGVLTGVDTDITPLRSEELGHLILLPDEKSVLVADPSNSCIRSVAGTGCDLDAGNKRLAVLPPCHDLKNPCDYETADY